VSDWSVAADDRTGALEAAAELARLGVPVTVTVAGVPNAAGVFDLGTRACSSDDAVVRVAALPMTEWDAHKIDSTLRGHWAPELRARRVATGRRVLVVPAWPAMGRTCSGGVVHVHGEPFASVHAALPEADLLPGVAALDDWLDGDGSFGAVDVDDDRDLAAVAQSVARHDVLVAGPAGAIGAVFAARFGDGARASAPLLREPALVVCGSATAVSREQIDRLRVARPDVGIVTPPPAEGDLSPEVSRRLAETVRDRLDGIATLVVIGGDTTAALLGDAPRRVYGTVLPGLPWSLDAHDGGPIVITKAGGFGDPDTLVGLFSSG
jgi:D-threonate/D-erythronate kinase